MSGRIPAAANHPEDTMSRIKISLSLEEYHLAEIDSAVARRNEEDKDRLDQIDRRTLIIRGALVEARKEAKP